MCPFSFTYFGGVQRHVLALQKEFKKRGVMAKILAPRQNPKEDYGPDVLLLGYSVTVPANASRIDFSWGNPFETEKVIKGEKFDLLHFHGLTPFLGWEILESARKLKIKSVFTVHTNPEKSLVAQSFPFIAQTYFNYILDRADGVIAVSKEAQKSVRHFKGPKEIIPNGVDLEVFSPNGEKLGRFNDNIINLLFVGRLDERKGVLTLLEAFGRLSKKLKNVRLIIAGEGGLKGRIRAWVRRERLKNVELLGKVSEPELPKLYRTARVFCAPSLGGESFGMVLLEAMATGLPVVASRISGYTEVLNSHASKFLFKAGDSVSLSKLLWRVAGSDRLRAEMSVWGLDAAKEYAWPKVAGRVLEFYERV